MSAHLLWVEAENFLPKPGRHRVYCFFGHPTQPSRMFAPLMDRVFLLTPIGERQMLDLRKGGWLPGYGHAEHWYAEGHFDAGGTYQLIAIRAPGVYDLGWHGAPKTPFLSYNYAKTWIQLGKGATFQQSAHLPMEVFLRGDPLQVRVGETVECKASLMGRDIKAHYSVSYWTWDEHEHPQIQRGETLESGRFTVTFTLQGLWFLCVWASLHLKGRWEATYSLPPFFEKGESLVYETTRHKITLTLWVI